MYGYNNLSHTRIFEWCNKVKERGEKVNDDSKSWRPISSRLEDIFELVRQVASGDHSVTS